MTGAVVSSVSPSTHTPDWAAIAAGIVESSKFRNSASETQEFGRLEMTRINLLYVSSFGADGLPPLESEVCRALTDIFPTSTYTMVQYMVCLEFEIESSDRSFRHPVPAMQEIV